FGSGATTANEERETARLNRYFNYPKMAASYQRDYTQEQWEAKIKESLDNGCPVPYAANNSGTGDTRHMFVIDGYTDNGYFHFNFGWNGSGNGWFKLDNITPYQGDNYSWNGNSEHYANFNLKPDIAKQTINVTVAPTNAGTVAINNNQAANEVTAELIVGSQATLTAKANDGYIFSHWSKAAETISTESTCKVTVDANGNDYVANFIEYSGPTTAEYTISPTTGIFTLIEEKSPTWTFSTTDQHLAKLTLQATCGTVPVYSMNAVSGLIQLYAFDYDMKSGITYTLAVPEGYLIQGYELKFKKGSRTYDITISNDETTLKPDGVSEQVLYATGLSTTSTSFYLNGTVANNFIKVTNFTVTIQKEGETTDINIVETTETNSIYNMNGQRLDRITEPGIYIVNGKKILKR
ncbi:MAG: C10 family peptidase, partial [Bacteroidaceae bacterium]|nr:C10 family peptidase [Bacteroidaceae bacterium]